MASPKLKLSSNHPGDFYVDSSCIDCGTCRWMAPETFNQAGEYASVYAQPSSPLETKEALKALLCCPTSSIGTEHKHNLRQIRDLFPARIADTVFHCGFHSESTFGATSYLVLRPQGNILVDCPRFSPELLKAIKALGGATLLFLTHKDDVGDHRLWARELGCPRLLHGDDIGPELLDIEHQPTSPTPLALDDDLVFIPTPGHTRGSSCLLYNNRFLFSGDHLAFSLARQRLIAFNTACWFDWDHQIRSVSTLLEFEFEHLLPGHGAPLALPKEEMRAQLRACVEWMKRTPALPRS